MDLYSQFMELFRLLDDEQKRRLIFLASMMAQDAAPQDSDADSADNGADADA